MKRAFAPPARPSSDDVGNRLYTASVPHSLPFRNSRVYKKPSACSCCFQAASDRLDGLEIVARVRVYPNSSNMLSAAWLKAFDASRFSFRWACHKHSLVTHRDSNMLLRTARLGTVLLPR